MRPSFCLWDIFWQNGKTGGKRVRVLPNLFCSDVFWVYIGFSTIYMRLKWSVFDTIKIAV